MAKKNDKKQAEKIQKSNDSKKVKQKKERKKSKKPEKKTSKKDEVQIIPSRIDLNVYNLLFDEINLFLKEMDTIKMKEIKERLILLDGKMIWIEKESEEDLLIEDEEEDDVDMEMEMLELGLDLDSAETLSSMHEASVEGFDINTMKAQIQKEKSWGNDLKDLLKDIESDDITKPIDDLMSKFVLYDLRVIIERAINEVFKLEGIVKVKLTQGEDKEKVKLLLLDQRLAVKKSLRDLLDKLKKEKPELLLTDDKLKKFKKLTHKEIVEMKAAEEQAFDEMVSDLLKE